MRPILAPPAPAVQRPGAVPSFSIVIAAYQAAETIAEAVGSALNQDVPACEVIVVDDGSTDATPEVLAPYERQITYIRQEHRGKAAAVNAAVGRAAGEFVSILDADDVYEPGRIDALGELAARRPDLDILMTDVYLEVHGNVVGRFCDATPFATVNQNVVIFKDCFLACPAIRRRTLLAAGGFDESLRLGEDWECWIRLLHAGAKAGIVNEPLLRYRIAGEHSLTDDRVGALRGRVEVLEYAARLDLTPEERRELERFLPRRRRRALLAEAELALRQRSASARRRAIEVTLARGMPAAARLKGLTAALAPRLAGQWLARREQKTGTSHIKRRLPGA